MACWSASAVLALAVRSSCLSFAQAFSMGRGMNRSIWNVIFGGFGIGWAAPALTVLVTLGAAASVNPYLPTRYWLAWVDFFRQPILWRNIDRGFAVQGIYVAVFLAAAWAHFATKDITS